MNRPHRSWRLVSVVENAVAVKSSIPFRARQPQGWVVAALVIVACSSQSLDSETQENSSSDSAKSSASPENPAKSGEDEGSAESSLEESSEKTSSDSETSNEDSKDEDSADTGDESPSDCEIPKFPDDIVIEEKTSASLVESQLGFAMKGVAVDNGSILCGDGFAVFVDRHGEIKDPLIDEKLSGQCVGVSRLSARQVVLALRQGTLLHLEWSPDGALKIVSIDTRENIQYFGIATAEKRDAQEETIWVAAGRDGIVSYANVEGEWQRAGAVPGAKDARALAHFGSRLLVADGYKQGTDEDSTIGGAEIRLLALDGSGVVDELGNLQGIAMGVVLRGNQALILRPGNGVDVFEVTETQLKLRDSVFMDGYPSDAMWIDDESFLVAAGSMMLRYSLDSTETTLLSTEFRPDRGDLLGGWFTGVWQSNAGIRALTDNALLSLKLGQGKASPQIRLDESTATLAAGQSERIVLLRNQGRAPLIVSNAAVASPFSVEISPDDNDEKPGCPGQFVVPPDDVLLTWLRFEGDESVPIVEPLSFRSNDPSQAKFSVTAEINRSAPKEGESLEDFSMMTVQGERWRLSEHKEKIVIAKLYNPS